MAVPTFSFSNADVSPGRSATIVEARKTHLLTSLTEKFGLAHAEFLATHVGFESDDLDWEGVRPLGKGAFGTVGLWAAKDGTGTIVREIAVKQCDLKRIVDIPREALVMKQLNRLQCTNILQLENFKLYTKERRCRYYLEVCPFGDLEELRKRHNLSRHYFPEQFLWHVFHGLAEAAEVMARGPFRDLDTGEPTTHKLLHLDIKPANVMLGYKAEKSFFESYPVVKLADFGLAELTGPDDPRNPKQMYGRGSAAYMPPEHRPFWRMSDHQNGQRISRKPKFRGWADPPITPNEQLEARSNIWPIGLVMYLLMTLGEVQDWLDEADFIKEEDFNRLGRHLVGPIRTERLPEYSQELRDLVYECLNPSIIIRPRPGSLVRRTRAGMERFRTTSRHGADTMTPPVIRHLNKSKSVLPAGQPCATPGNVVSPHTPTAMINRRVKRPRSGGHEAPPIIISDSANILPAELPPGIRDEQDGKRRRLASEEWSVPGRRKKVTNIAGEVIVISDDTPFAEKAFGPPGMPNEDEGSEMLRKHRSEGPSRSAGSFSLITHPGSKKDYPYIPPDEEEAKEGDRDGEEEEGEGEGEGEVEGEEEGGEGEGGAGDNRKGYGENDGEDRKRRG